MKKIFLIFFVSSSMWSQNTDFQKLNSEILTVETSLIIPVGSLANKFDYAQAYGFWFKLGEEKKMTANIGFTTIFLQKARSVNYKYQDVDYIINSNKFGFDIGIRIMKIVPFQNKKYYSEFGSTIGFHYLDYDFPSQKKEENKESKKDSLRNVTFLFSPEVKLMYKNVGLKFQYRFTPFYFLEGFELNFGSHSVALGIVYKQ